MFEIPASTRWFVSTTFATFAVFGIFLRRLGRFRRSLGDFLGLLESFGELWCRVRVVEFGGWISLECQDKLVFGSIYILPTTAGDSAECDVEFAQDSGQTLVGFLRGETMNIYTHPGRIAEG